MCEQLGQLLAHEQMIGGLPQVFGVLALILASVGLYGITAYSVARRTSEIGVRTALGATRGQVVRLILAARWRRPESACARHSRRPGRRPAAGRPALRREDLGPVDPGRSRPPLGVLRRASPG